MFKCHTLISLIDGVPLPLFKVTNLSFHFSSSLFFNFFERLIVDVIEATFKEIVFYGRLRCNLCRKFLLVVNFIRGCFYLHFII